jgi:alpha-glucosidase
VTNSNDSQQDPWFRHRALYQIYPRSFRDSNGDGVGDLRGITQKLDYLAGKNDSLGIGAIWISPFYPSPMADFGYDVANYCDVDPLFGTLADFQELLHEAHARDVKVIIDFVPNHTSDEHPWFVEARRSRDNPKRNWYIWKDAKPDGSEPNNWQSTFGGPAWTFDDTTGQYYLHSFLNKQPDLNWDNPEVRSIMKDQMKFWLDMGVDGFRVDAVSPLSKDPDFQDNPPRENYKPGVDDPHKAWDRINSQNGPHLFDYLREMADFVGSYDERFMITEAYPHGWDNTASYLQFYRQVNPHACAPFNFEGIGAPWQAEVFKDFIDKFEYAIEPEYIPVYCLGNHDRSRLASRFGSKNARTAAMLLLTLPGMPTMYYGDELGMTDTEILPDQIRDPYELNVPGKGNGRDPERTPMQWDASKSAGFTDGEPWLPINPNHFSVNVVTEFKDVQSLLNLYRQLLHLRAGSHAMQRGAYVPVDTPEGVFGFKRVTGNQTMLVLLNFTNKAITIPDSLQQMLDGNVELSTYLDNGFGLTSLRPNEGRIYNLN